MKTFFSLLSLFFFVQITSAQNIISGTVRDDKGNPVRSVFVEDTQHATAVFTDSLGNFSIAGEAGAGLLFQAAGFKDTTINNGKIISGQGIVMRSSGSGVPARMLSTLIVDGNSDDHSTMAQGGAIAPGHRKGKLKGNQYLFDNFVHGYMVSSSGQMLYKADYMFDYDKISGGLLLTTDDKKIIEINWDQTKSFVLYSSTDERLEFEKVPSIDPSHYIQVLVSGPKYKIYKLIKTKFVKSDFVNKGIVSYGNDYDEFVDDADYFVFDVKNNLLQKLSLRKKSIKGVFAKEADKAVKFLADNSGDINDVYLRKLGDTMNN